MSTSTSPLKATPLCPCRERLFVRTAAHNNLVGGVAERDHDLELGRSASLGCGARRQPAVELVDGQVLGRAAWAGDENLVRVDVCGGPAGRSTEQDIPLSS